MKNIIIILFLLPLFCRAQSDTVKVIMLVCDTSEITRQRNGEVFFTLPPQYGYDEKKSNSMHWQYGYSVRKKHRGDEMVNDGVCMNCPDWYEHLYFLDELLKPLGKNIIVWDSKVIK